MSTQNFSNTQDVRPDVSEGYILVIARAINNYMEVNIIWMMRQHEKIQIDDLQKKLYIFR